MNPAKGRNAIAATVSPRATGRREGRSNTMLRIATKSEISNSMVALATVDVVGIAPLAGAHSVPMTVAKRVAKESNPKTVLAPYEPTSTPRIAARVAANATFTVSATNTAPPVRCRRWRAVHSPHSKRTS